MWKALMACLLVAGCAEQPARHGNDALGVSDFVVHAGASELDVVGVDSQGAMLAHLHLRTGMVTPEDWELATSGRELSFEIMGNTYSRFASAGLAPLTLPLTGDPYLNSFVLDPFVAPILERWGVVFADHARAEPAEVGYAQCQQSPNITLTYFAPCTLGGVTYGPGSTCYDYWGMWAGNAIWDQKVVCADPAHSQAERMCASAFATTPCGTAGPNGCAPCGPPISGGGSTQCSGDSCTFVSGGSGGGGGPGGSGCHGTNCSITCSSDDECCGCGGYCSLDGQCVY